ncbi:MAG: sugar phosphate isomerase/epimerase family protein [Planctomycetota bacterium]
MPRYAICNETFGDMDPKAALSMAADAGYTGWEVAPFMLGKLESDQPWITHFDLDARHRYRDLVTDAGLEILGIHWLLAHTTGFHLTTRNTSVRSATANHFNELIDLCADLGGSIMVLGSPGQRNRTEGQSMDEAMANAADVLRSALPKCHERNVKIALEPLGPSEGNFLNTADEARQLMAMIDDPAIGLHLDVKAMSTEAMAIDQVIRNHADAMIHFHANDPNLLGPGMGDVAFEPIMQSLADVQYDGWISVEVFDYTPGVETIVQQSIANLKRFESLGA